MVNKEMVLNVIAVLISVCGVSSASVLMNGSFEADPFDAGWSNTGGPATVHTGLVAGSEQAAQINATGNDLGQVFDALGSEWVVELYIAIPDPQAYAGANRSFNMLLTNHTSTNWTGLNMAINMRINGTGTGSIQLYDNAHGGGWANANSGGEITYSVDGNGDGDFSDPEDTLNVHRIQVVGRDWGTPGVSYDLYASAPNSDVLMEVAAGLTAFHNNVPDGTLTNNNVTALIFRTGYGFAAGQTFVADEVYAGSGNTARMIKPLDSSTNVLRKEPLHWGPPASFDPVGYNVWVYTDPNDVTQGTKVVDGALQNSYTEPGDGWGFSTEYFWRADAIETGNIIHEGIVYSFTTVPPQPYIIEAPKSVTVPPAISQVELTVTAENVAEYVWYKNSIVTGGNTSALVIPNAELDDAYYTCKISNGDPAEDITTEPARVMVEKLVGHWKFEQNLANEIAGGGDGAITGDPNYVTDGIDGYAYELANDKFIQITGSEEYYNFYPQGLTAIAWIKTTAGEWAGVMSKRSVTTESNEGWVIATGLNGSSVQMEGIGSVNNGAVDNDAWRMMVLSYDPANGIMRYYLDGVIVNQSVSAASENIPLNDQMLAFGSSSGQGSAFYNGLVDEVKVYNYAIDPFTIAQEFTTLKPDGGPVCVENPELDFTGPDGAPDCRVDVYEFAALAGQWLNCNIVPSSDCY